MNAKLTDPIRRLAQSHTNLNLFAAIQVLAEGSLISSTGHAGANRINRICQTEIQRELRLYDKAEVDIRRLALVETERE